MVKSVTEVIQRSDDDTCMKEHSLSQKPRNLPELRLHIYIPISFFSFLSFICVSFFLLLSIYTYDFCDSLKIHTTSTMPKNKSLQIMNPTFGITIFLSKRTNCNVLGSNMSATANLWQEP